MGFLLVRKIFSENNLKKYQYSEKSVVLKQDASKLRESLQKKGVEFFYDKKLEKIEQVETTIRIHTKREKLEYDYIIYASSPYFIKQLHNNLKEKESNIISVGEEKSASKDAITLSDSILSKLGYFKNLS